MLVSLVYILAANQNLTLVYFLLGSKTSKESDNTQACFK